MHKVEDTQSPIDMQEYADYIKSLLFFGFLSIIFLRIAQSTGFFRFPTTVHRSPTVSLKMVIVIFAIYLSITSLIAPSCGWLMESFYLKWFKIPPPDSAFGFLQLIFLTLIFLLFYLYSRSQNSRLFKEIWKNHAIERPQLVSVDLGMGILTWVIAFPLVTAVGQLIDLILYFFLNVEGYEQVAVHYLKTTLESPPLLVMALLTILIAAPCIEEFLFRGCLQTFLKQYMSTKGAILFTSVCFSLFHFSLSQGLGNISLCASLFVLALFLGFIYERQGSLFASVGLHMTFNLVSTGRVLFFP